MATLTLTSAQSVPVALTGVNVDPMVSYVWDLKALFASAAAADVIESPAFDMNAIAPKTNRLSAQKLVTTAAADVVAIKVSPDGTNWFTAPLYNGAAGSISTVNTSAAEVAVIGLPTMRYVKLSVTLAAAMSTQTVAKASLSFMRF